MLAGVTIGLEGMGWVLVDVCDRKLSGLEDKLVSHFKLAAEKVRSDIREFFHISGWEFQQRRYIMLKFSFISNLQLR